MKLFAVALFLVASATSLKVPYDGFEVHRVVPSTEQQVAALRTMSEYSNGLSFWTEVAGVNKPVDIMVPPHLLTMFKDFINLQHLNEEIYISNVQEKIDLSKSKSTRAFGWTDYYRLADVRH